MSISIEALKTKFDSLLQTVSNHINGKLGREEAAVSAAKLTNPFTLSLSNDATATANVDGAQAVNLSVILKTVMAAPGTYTKVTVDAKGRVVAAEALIASDIPNLDASKITTGVFAVARIPILNQNTTGNAATATKLATPRQIAASGDATGTVAFDGSGDVSIPLTLKSSGVAAGAYGDSVTIPTFSVDGKGIVTLAQNVAIRSASLTQTGLVRLNSAINSTLESQAATPLAVKTAYDLAAAAIPATQKGVADGVCELDATAKIPVARVPVLNQNTTGTAARVSATAATGSFADLVTGGMAGNGSFRLRIGGDVVDGGWVELATFDNGIEPIYVRQYNTQPDPDVIREAAILDQAGKTSFPVSVSAPIFIGNGAGGAFADMYSRQGPLHAAVTHSGSSYAPLGSMRYTGTGGVKGEYSFGHLSRVTTDPGIFAIHHITDGGVEKLWTFDGANGDFTSAGEVYNFSDKRLKEGFNVIGNALDRIDYVTGYTFVRKDTGEVQAGFIADEWLSALPEVVENKHEYLRLAYGNTNALTLNAVKELKAVVFKQAEEIEVLKNLVAQLIK